MLILLSLGGVFDVVSILVLQKQESDTMLDSSHSLGEHFPVILEILELLCSVMKLMILKYCQ